MRTLFFPLVKVRKVPLLIAVIFICNLLKGQLRWDGEAGDGLWNTPGNWVGNMPPSATEDVKLDHSAVTGNYTVTLPAGGSSITVRTLTIYPSVAQTIEVILPSSNTAIPAFTAIGSSYGLVIHPGGIFRNSSGGSAGTPVNISDSIKINNGGLYIHNTSRAHATNITVLSKAPGTEQGTFEFDVPGGSGYTVSIAGRVYGNMVLSAAAAGGSKSYTSTGSTTVTINGEFRLNAGVNYSLNFNGGFIIDGDFIHHGNVFDISSGSNSNRISVKKHCTISGIISESGTGLPLIEFEGKVNQDLSVTGAVNGNCTIRINNNAGIRLQTPFSVFYKLDLANGNIRTTSANIFIMQDNATYSGGSPNSFIDGPLRKMGDDDFQFPVGKQGDYAPVSISGTGGMVTDQFEAEYFLGNPTINIGTAFENPPMVRISGLEYWNLDRISGTSPKKITLSVRTYSNATLLEKLVVSRWDIAGQIWRNQGNSAYAGIASGTVTSGDVLSFGVFTVASTVLDQNPLPFRAMALDGKNENGNAILSWKIDPGMDLEGFEVLRSQDKIHFEGVKKLRPLFNQLNYTYSEKLFGQASYYYKVKVMHRNGKIEFSNIVPINYRKGGMELMATVSSITPNMLNISIYSPGKGAVELCLLNVEGKTMRKVSVIIFKGSNAVAFNISQLPAGIYYIAGSAFGMRTAVMKVMKY